jgi:glutamate carboxypeptidase
MERSRSSLAALALLGLLASIPAAAAAPDERLKAAAEQAKPALIETLHDMVMICMRMTNISTKARSCRGSI